MMRRRLTLLRHGHAEVSAPGGDVDRALDNIGRAEVTSAAAALALFEKPTRLIVSSARRTRETAAILVQTLALQSAQIEYLSELYLASAATLQRVIEMQPDDHTQLCLIGHNPGLSDFVLEALPAGPPRDAYRGLTTAGWASWAFTASRWRAFAPDASYTIAQSISPDNARAI